MKTTFASIAMTSLIVLSGCHHDENKTASSPASTTSVPASPQTATHPMPPGTAATVSPADATGNYQIPPFPVTGVEVCDHYAQEIRRCMNQYGSDMQRHTTEKSVNALLTKVQPKPGQAPDEWITSDCRRAQQAAVRQFNQCGIQ